MMVKCNPLKPLSCKVRNNMETTLPSNEFKFNKPEKWRNTTKIDWRID